VNPGKKVKDKDGPVNQYKALESEGQSYHAHKKSAYVMNLAEFCSIWC